MTHRLRGISALVRRGQWQSALVALLCASLFLTAASLYSLHQFAVNTNDLVARSVAFSGEPALRFRDIEAMREIATEMAHRENLAEISVTDAQGQLWLRYESDKTGPIDAIARYTDRIFLRKAAVADIASNGFVLGTVSLRSDGRLLLRYLSLVVLALLLCVGATTVAVLAISYRLSRAIVAPVKDLTGLTRAVRISRSYDRRASSTAVREFNDLADDFNSLLSELQTQQAKVAARHTDLQAANESLRHASQHDGLTGLANRVYLAEYLNELLPRYKQQGLRAAALFVDVDKFKSVNDLHGHEAGDVLLIELARRLLASVRASDFVARLGGDEFIVILSPLGDAQEIDSCVQRIHEALQPALTLKDGTLLSISVTIGAALYPEHAQNLDELIRSADAAMYSAKTRRRGSFAAFQRNLHEDNLSS